MTERASLFALLLFVLLLVFYVPGLSLTLAMSEVAHRNLVAGSARFIHALLVLMMLGAGATSAWLLLEPLMDPGRLLLLQQEPRTTPPYRLPPRFGLPTYTADHFRPVREE